MYIHAWRWSNTPKHVELKDFNKIIVFNGKKNNMLTIEM
jgi:hypothetical protein